jgi:hypothetical protein
LSGRGRSSVIALRRLNPHDGGFNQSRILRPKHGVNGFGGLVLAVLDAEPEGFASPEV